ncbi:hypothetical protein [Leclercia adecarboxylata]|uniref:hypothetical protein n=1 Tax=Leclercia adecarboxylata TaxID=83655 RepID=UPI0021F1E9A2|nr:hypothetical protein [Leclercia adecarboxylata]UYM55455.1 hypothetical protein N5937_22500 [Leclercia adecarboxylata]
MKDLYLRFTDAEEMRTQLIAAGFVVDEEQGGLYHPDISLDVVGVITAPGEITNPGQENEVITFVHEPGYHANLRVMNDELDLSPLHDFVVNPKTPARVWA